LGDSVSTSEFNYFFMSEDIRKTIAPGMIVKVHQKIKETDTKGQEKERIQIFEGMVLAVKHGTEIGATFTVRKVSDGVGVERIFPINSPVVDKVEMVRQMRVRRSKLYFLRDYTKKLKEVKKPKKVVEAKA
jgi:large subunit ribosomal protein L19